MRPVHVRSEARAALSYSSPSRSLQALLRSTSAAAILSFHYKHSLNLRPLQFLSTSPPVLKSGGKQNSKHNVETASAKVSTLPHDDRLDLSDLESRLQQILSRLRNDLAELRPGGRFNPRVVENLRVSLNKNNRDTERLGALAQVVPKGGRSIVLYIGEETHVKPVSSAILSSSLSLNPQPSTTNPLELTIQIPPPTTESRKQTIAQALKVGTDAYGVIRMARAAHQKKLRAMGLANAAGPDDLKRAHDKMEKAVEKANTDAKKIIEDARKMLETG